MLHYVKNYIPTLQIIGLITRTKLATQHGGKLIYINPSTVSIHMAPSDHTPSCYQLTTPHVIGIHANRPLPPSLPPSNLTSVTAVYKVERSKGHPFFLQVAWTRAVTYDSGMCRPDSHITYGSPSLA